MVRRLPASRRLEVIDGEGPAGLRRPAVPRRPLRSGATLMPRELPATVHVPMGSDAPSRRGVARRPVATDGGEPDLRGVPT